MREFKFSFWVRQGQRNAFVRASAKLLLSVYAPTLSEAQEAIIFAHSLEDFGQIAFTLPVAPSAAALLLLEE